MPLQPFRTRTLRRVKVRTPSGLVIHYKKRKPKSSHCSKCREELHGVPIDLPYKVRQMSKTERRPERMYGGFLCPECLKNFLKEKYMKKQYELEIGRLCIKISGREAGSYCVIVDKKDNNFVIVDGQVKRRKCNINHLISLEQKLDINKNASTEEVVKKLKQMGIEVKVKKQKKTPEKKEVAKKEAKKKVSKKTTRKKSKK